MTIEEAAIWLNDMCYSVMVEFWYVSYSTLRAIIKFARVKVWCFGVYVPTERDDELRKKF